MRGKVARRFQDTPFDTCADAEHVLVLFEPAQDVLVEESTCQRNAAQQSAQHSSQVVGTLAQRNGQFVGQHGPTLAA